MKRTVLSAVVLMLTSVVAWAGGEVPQLKYFSYRKSGGMMPESSRFYELARDKAGNRTLRMRGDCWLEEIEIPVKEEVFEKVAGLIMEHGLQKATGIYKAEMIIHDAPSVSFSAAFEGYSSFSGSGDIPLPMSKGLGVICTYLESLRGNTKARGHLDQLQKMPNLTGMQLFNGIELVNADGMEPELINIATDYLADKTDDPNGVVPAYFRTYARRDDNRTYVVVESSHYKYADIYFVVQPGGGRHLIDREELVRYLAGSYRASDGKTYIFTADGRFKSSPAATAVPLEFKETADDICSCVKIGAQWYNFHVTDKGLRLCRTKKIKEMEYECVGTPIELTIDEEEGSKGRWKFTSDVVIERGMLSYVPRRVLRKMADELSARRGFKPSDENKAELEGRSWYKEAQSQPSGKKNFSDIEQINFSVIESAYNLRDEGEKDDDFPLYEE